jgi:CTP synthase
MFCNVKKEAVISAADAEDLYAVPLMLEREGIWTYISEKLQLDQPKVDRAWEKMVERRKSCRDKKFFIAIVGKYAELEDSYLSIKEAIKHAATELGYNVDTKWIEAEDLEEEKEVGAVFDDVRGILVPGGFGVRGAEGKIKAIEYARENKIPFLGSQN